MNKQKTAHGWSFLFHQITKNSAGKETLLKYVHHYFYT